MGKMLPSSAVRAITCMAYHASVPRDQARTAIIRQALASHDVSALVCALPANVLMLSGYFPIVGTSVAIAATDGRILVLAPQDEEELAKSGNADRVITFPTGSLDQLISASQGIARPLQDALDSLHLSAGRIGWESGPWLEPASYTAIHLYGNSLKSLLEESLPRATLFDAGALLHDLRQIHTPTEIARLRTSGRTAAEAFHRGAAAMSTGVTEAQAAAAFRTPLYVTDPSLLDQGRTDGLVSCMSGPNAASAYGAYARSRGRTLQRGDLVLVHCNSHVNGYWTDITRTFCLGRPDSRQQEMYDAVFAARDAALAAVKPAARAADVDRAARDVLQSRGFGPAFKHPTGHGVGFAAIDHNAPPRLHPRSPDVLDVGMVFNIEPGIYLDDQGMRHCDMVAVTPTGYELLTPFQQEPAALVV
jgi:Xaa-Pro aminopeptidase